MSWNAYEQAAEKGPGALAWKIVPIILVVAAVLSVGGFVLGWFGEAAAVAREEFGPREMLRKYEWFKDAAAQLDKKRADITVYETRVKQMVKDYEGTRRKDWDRTDKEQQSVWQSELAGMKASYNGLAAEYNSQMAKFNWRFANRGELPKGAAEPLPREFKAYMKR